ncbi:MAG: AmmeMemoRadiSam system protein B [Gammaproteobacteria bacterium]|jgi:AmmeMemoRadiSam system protein B|nr:AmmeMemoRadiSam system protein B [Gammaproteobacteria bacterium]
MSSIRHPAVADMFYPGDPVRLSAEIQSMLAAATATAAATPKAIIVPHAGYVYSGPIAANAYAQLIPAKNKIRRVVLLGPCHRVPLTGLATSSADYFETPLGTIPIDRELSDKILQLPQVQEYDLTHAQEHSLEVQLPFLQKTLDEFTLLPLVVGDASGEEVHEVLEAVWGGDETLIVISSDLSHYHDYSTAQSLDTATCRAIENLDDKHIEFGQACGRNPILGLVLSARKHHLKVATLDLRNSGDTAGGRGQVVGYGAWAFVQPEA